VAAPGAGAWVAALAAEEHGGREGENGKREIGVRVSWVVLAARYNFFLNQNFGPWQDA
jgi:hypothetical protein